MSSFSLETVRTHGVDRLAKETGLGVRTIYRWAVHGIPGEGTIREVREATIAKAVQNLAKARSAAKPRKRARAVA